MRISDWNTNPARTTATMRNAVTWLNRNLRRLQKDGIVEEPFDYPDYWGMPKVISLRLSPDEVDWLQCQLNVDGQQTLGML